MLISELIDGGTKLDRTTLNRLVKESDIVEKTGLSAGFIQQCIDTVLWTWKSYQDLHKEWEKKIKRAQERLECARDDKEKQKIEKSLKKMLKREPSRPTFEDKTPCRIDSRTGKVQKGIGKFSALWIHISTLEKNNTIDIPLNPSQYHLSELKNAKINDFQIIKKGNKYYIHITITKVVDDKPISSIGGGDQGLNRTIAVVLLEHPLPREEHILDAAKRDLLDKYDEIVSSLQEAEKWDKLREIRNKRENVSEYGDWILANDVAEFTDGSLIMIGNTHFRQTQFRGNGMPKLRKRVGKWSYSRQRKYIALKRAEKGYSTLFDDEYNTSRKCHICGSMLTTRKWLDGYSWIECHSCGAKIDADFNAAYNISDKIYPQSVWVYNSSFVDWNALRCRDDWLKAGMNMDGVKPHASL
jgi:transposase